MFFPSVAAPFLPAAAEPEGSLPEQGPRAPGALQQQTPKVQERCPGGRGGDLEALRAWTLAPSLSPPGAPCVV